MQTLGVSGEREKRDEGRLKSLFWPTIEDAWDVDTIGRQGFWICLIIAAYQVIMGIIAGSAATSPAGVAGIVAFGLITGFVYFLGGMGVRETSWPAAALVFSLFSVNLFFGFAIGHFPGFIYLIADALLLTTLRAAIIASRCPPPAEGEDRPMRFNQNFADKLADQWPAAAWPVLRTPFFLLGGLLFLLTVAGTFVIFLVRLGILPNPTAS
jgi:hypothetical protein